MSKKSSAHEKKGGQKSCEPIMPAKPAGVLEPTFPGMGEKNLEGPYYRPGIPELTVLAGPDTHGIPLEFEGSVQNHFGDCLTGARVELWQADASGNYDNECGEHELDEEEFKFRGFTSTDQEGKFKFHTIVPGNYPVSETWTRAKHLHFKIYKQCHWPLATQIFLMPDEYAQDDELFCSTLAVELEYRKIDGKTVATAKFPFVLFALGPSPRVGYEPGDRIEATMARMTGNPADELGSLPAAVASLAGPSYARCAGRSRGVVRIGDVYIDVTAEGEGEPIVLLPSSGRDSLDYDEVAAGLAACGHRVLRPQPRGMLGSRGPLTEITFHDYASDVAAVIEAEADGPAIVLGHAFGNWIARAVATDHPQLVKGVVLAAAAANDIPEYLFEISRKCADPTLSFADRIKYLQMGFFVRAEDAVGWLTGWHLEARKAQSEARKATPREDWWWAGLAPILDLQAEKDPWRPEATREELQHAMLDRVAVALVEDASHALLPEQPNAVVREIANWTAQL